MAATIRTGVELVIVLREEAQSLTVGGCGI
jgi:hypothetical protein